MGHQQIQYFIESRKTLNITFNYRYYTNEDDYINYQLRFDRYISKSIAYSLEEVGEVIQFAEEQQKGALCSVIFNL